MFFRAIWDKWPLLVFENIKKFPSLRSGNFIMFLKTNLGYLSQIAQKNMQLLILITVFGKAGYLGVKIHTQSCDHPDTDNFVNAF